MAGPPPYFSANLKCAGRRKIIFQAVASNILFKNKLDNLFTNFTLIQCSSVYRDAAQTKNGKMGMENVNRDISYLSYNFVRGVHIMLFPQKEIPPVTAKGPKRVGRQQQTRHKFVCY